MIDPFLDNGFMQRALVAGILVSLTCAVVGTYVVLRGMAFIGDALAHGVLPGVAMATILGLPTMLGAGVGAVVMIGGVGLITARSKLSNDTAIGLLFIGLLALGVVLVSSSDSLTGDLEEKTGEVVFYFQKKIIIWPLGKAIRLLFPERLMVNSQI